MELWLRYRQARECAEWDEKYTISSQKDWKELIHHPELISSVLWPQNPVFRPSGRHYESRRHPHEINYQNDPERNRSYLEGCQRLAHRIRQLLAGARILVYAPMRGAWPIWQVTSQFLQDLDLHPYFPVTSSFVKYPKKFDVLSHRGKLASGRFTNILELTRLRPFLHSYDVLLYMDEIISGGMMWGHLKELTGLGIHRQIKVVTAGLADQFGERSSSNRHRITNLVQEGKLYAFLWEGCASEITEDQKFLLGVHYTDYNLGPHVVPMLDQNREWFEERKLFLQDVMEVSPNDNE